jgi:hypothetical protein
MKANLVIVLVMAMPAAHGQAPAFEVTSVKFNKLSPRERHIEFDCSPRTLRIHGPGFAERFLLGVQHEAFPGHWPAGVDRFRRRDLRH